jgi:hypothetical protein
MKMAEIRFDFRLRPLIFFLCRNYIFSLRLQLLVHIVDTQQETYQRVSKLPQHKIRKNGMSKKAIKKNAN